MLYRSLLYLVALTAVTNGSPLPLNINLGAYSPAIVVGDGAIEFSGAEAAAESAVNALQGGAVAGAAAAAVENGATQREESNTAAPTIDDQLTLLMPKTAALPIPGSGLGKTKQLEPRPRAVQAGGLRKRQGLAGFDRALRYAEAALVKGPKVHLGTGEDGAGVGIIVDNNVDAAARAGKGITVA